MNIPLISTSFYGKDKTYIRTLLKKVNITCKDITFPNSNDDVHTFKLTDLHVVDTSLVTDKQLLKAQNRFAHQATHEECIHHIIMEARDEPRKR